MQLISINELKPHPRNSEFFDDMTGDKWNEFLTSVSSRGVIEPIVVTPDKMIVSGHQRVRACKELGISSIMCDVHTYDNEDQILQDLLETNIRQRGDVGGSAKKVGLRIKELERIYGIKHGGAGYYGNQHEESSKNSKTPKTQERLAEEFDISVATLQNYKILADMIPELDELVSTGIVTKTTALAIMKELSQEEQEQLISQLDASKKHTAKEIQGYIDQINYLKENPVVPSDYEDLKKRLAAKEKEAENLTNQRDQIVERNRAVLEEVKRLKKHETPNPDMGFKQKMACLEDDLKEANERIAELEKENAQYKEDTNHLLNRVTELEKTDLDKDCDAAYGLWKASSEFVKNILSPFHYDEIVARNENNIYGEYIMKSCHLLIDEANNIIQRYSTIDVIDAEIIN